MKAVIDSGQGGYVLGGANLFHGRKEVKKKEKSIELTCRQCGFTTFSFSDMVYHLGRWRKDGYFKEDWCPAGKVVDIKIWNKA